MVSFPTVPVAAVMPVSQTLLFLLPEHFSPFRWYVLVGRHRQNKPDSSALNFLSNL